MAPAGICKQQAQLAPGRGRVGQGDVASVGDALQKLLTDEIVDTLAILVAVARIQAIEALAEQDVAGTLRSLGLQQFLVKRDQRALGLQTELPVLRFDFVLPGLERQVQNRQGEKHLREVAGGVDHVAREEGLAGFGGGVVAPEGVHLHEGAVPLLLGHVVVVVLGPFLGRLQLAEELPRISPSIGPELK